ncbi:hypothetical protein [Falsiroseomonas tokyonensis]|uniref:Uncharacterized protein n=1 Tax=Falsiroseomonas tokyonensis TaxID=430521 RepID=A0ABV7BXR8_9PROT|nr:hypothetical protein [Falsiroseomonas tokyonensis]MBU8538711.1 hypothetical protein [Falsiroseomonas tokyonensis]
MMVNQAPNKSRNKSPNKSPSGSPARGIGLAVILSGAFWIAVVSCIA